MQTSPPDPAEELARLRALLAERDAALAEQQTALAEQQTALAEQQTALAEQQTALAKSQRHALHLTEKLRSLQHQLDLLKRQLFGKRSEKLDPRQLQLEFAAAIAEATRDDYLSEEFLSPEDLAALTAGEDLADEWEEDAGGKRRRRRKDRFPPDLPVVREPEIHPAPEELLCACGCTKERMGEDVKRSLAHQPERFYWREQVRVKYLCPGCREITRPPLPPAPIWKSLADTSLLVDLTLSKYSDHLPLDRLSQIYRRSGVDLSKSTLSSWITALLGESLLGGVAAQVSREVCSRSHVQTDETGILVLDPSHPEGRFKGRMWVFCGESGELFYEYTPTKETRWPKARLAEFSGVLQADAYGGFDALFRPDEHGRQRIVEAGCSAHARRKFKEAYDADKSREAPQFALSFYRKLFDVEREAKAKKLSPEARLALRKKKSVPLVKSFYAWLEVIQPALIPSDPLTAAVRYAINHKEALTRFLSDGRIELDNNRSERSLRQVAVGRKNWLFAGSERGAESAAAAYTLIMSCKELGLPVRDYLIDVLEQLAANPATPRAELTPRAWHAVRERAASKQ